MQRVSVFQDLSLKQYPDEAPFSPSEKYPEYSEGDLARGDNGVYAAVRSALRGQMLDAEQFGTAAWNPFGPLIQPGNTVVVKPNFVMDRHILGLDVNAIFTHGSVLRAVIDYIRIALRGSGRIIIGDAPLQSCNFDRVLAHNRIPELIAFYQSAGGPVPEVQDFRREVTVRDSVNLTLERVLREGSYRVVNIGSDSMLAEISEGYRNYRVTNYDVSVMARNHDRTVNEYFIAQPILDADAIINIPKLKTHRKAGITAALKNLIGINCNKDCLPHHRFGSKEMGSDEYLHRDRVKALATMLIERQDTTASHTVQKMLGYPIKALMILSKVVQKDPFREGSWYGNDTLWRTILDLNRILLYADTAGQLTSTIQRKVFHLVDAVIAGDHEGPIEPTPKQCGMIICGENAAAVDAVSATMMGFDFNVIPAISQAFLPHRYPVIGEDPHEICIAVNGTEQSLEQLGDQYNLKFVPTQGWSGIIERHGSKRN